MFVEEGGEWFIRSMSSDLKFPILIFKQKDGRFDIIDGNHRVWKVWKTRAKEIKAYIYLTQIICLKTKIFSLF